MPIHQNEIPTINTSETINLRRDPREITLEEYIGELEPYELEVMGLQELRKGNTDLAIAYFLISTQKHPDSPECWKHLVIAATDYPEIQLEAAKGAIKLYPNDIAILNAIANTTENISVEERKEALKKLDEIYVQRLVLNSHKFPFLLREQRDKMFLNFLKVLIQLAKIVSDTTLKQKYLNRVLGLTNHTGSLGKDAREEAITIFRELFPNKEK